MRLLTSEEIRKVEQHASVYGFSFQRMMENAGAACSRNIRNIIDKNQLSSSLITVICGKGNNGGDGFVIARKLRENGYNVNVILSNGYPKTEESIGMYKLMLDLSVKSVWFDSDKEKAYSIIKKSDIIVDAVYGFGFYGKTDTETSALFDAVNSSKAIVFSVDVPSGVYCDSGLYNDHCIKADYTIAISSLKPAHILYPAALMCGDIIVVNIGIPEDSFVQVNNRLYTCNPREIKAKFPERTMTGNKGTFGTVLIICGSKNMIGAVELSAKAALRSGAGLVKVAFPECIYLPVSTKLTEAVLVPCSANKEGTFSADAFNQIAELLDSVDAVLIGCGIGVNEDTKSLVNNVITNAKCPVILDADAINAVSYDLSILRKSAVPIVLTPHPGEMARLIGTSVETVQKDRISIADTFVNNYYVTLVLKGSNTIVLSGNNDSIYVNSSGNTGLSKGGSGDLLAGLISGFIAQGIDVQDSAVSGVFIHGYLGEYVSNKSSLRGMLPSDMIDAIPAVLGEFE